MKKIGKWKAQRPPQAESRKDRRDEEGAEGRGGLMGTATLTSMVTY